MNESNRRMRRRWFQVSLRSIFLLMLVVAAYFAGYRTAARQAEQTQQAERDARLQAERSAAETKLAQEMALRQLETQMMIRAENAALQSQLKAQDAAAFAKLQADLDMAIGRSHRTGEPERIEPEEK
jgi:hypothetical protein